MKPKLEQFGVWEVDGAGTDQYGYWKQYDNLEDAVSENGDGTRVYKIQAKSVGTFRRSVVMERVKKLTKKLKK